MSNYKNRDVNITRLDQLEEGRYYHLYVLQSILKNLGLNYSIFTIRNCETWRCLNYKCGKRYDHPVSKCPKCGGKISPPIIHSPRTKVAGGGYGHRRYLAKEIRKIVSIFKERE